MLTTYLELQKALIKKQEWDKEKSLTDNFKKLKLIEKLDSFHDAVLDYMKLEAISWHLLMIDLMIYTYSLLM
nr:hypothetical protein [Mycoplasmopsis bovis]